MTDDPMNATSPAVRPTVGAALLMTLGVIPLIGGYVLLCGAIGNIEFFTGFLFLLAWTGFEHGKLAKLPHAALGSALGLALGFVLKLMMGSSLGESGGYVFGALALTVVFCHILGWLSLIVNFSCMTFLATITIRSEEHTSELQSLMRISYAVFCLKKKNSNT